MSFVKSLQSLIMWITYVYIAEASPTDPPLKLILAIYAYILTQMSCQSITVLVSESQSTHQVLHLGSFVSQVEMP